VSVAGIDFSSKWVDVVLLADEGFQAEHHRFKVASRVDSFQAARNLRGVFPGRSWWEDRGVWLVGVEEPYSHQPPAMVALGRIQGAIAALLPPNLRVTCTPQTQWLKVFTGRAKLPRDSSGRKELARETAQLFGFEASAPDGYDAFGIACSTRALHEDETSAAEAA
jgi:hypothetical protein